MAQSRTRKWSRANQSSSDATTLTEICRRYVATAVALSKAMGVPCSQTFIKEHRESIACCYIEAGRCNVRLAASVNLPSLGAAEVKADVITSDAPGITLTNVKVEAVPPAAEPPEEPPKEDPLPTHVPQGLMLPCAGKLIADLLPGPLVMLINRSALAMHPKPEEPWISLLSALQRERVKRLAAGQKQSNNGTPN